MVRVAAVEACMQALSPGTCRFRVARAVAFVLLFLLAVPLLLGFAFGVSPPRRSLPLSVRPSPPGGRGVVGLSLGLHPVVVLLFLTSVAAAVLIGILEVCDLFAERSRTIQRLLSKIDVKTGSIDYLKRYGADAHPGHLDPPRDCPLRNPPRRRVDLPVPAGDLPPLHACRMDDRGHRGHGGDDGARSPGLLGLFCTSRLSSPVPIHRDEAVTFEAFHVPRDRRHRHPPREDTKHFSGQPARDR
ncbi:hypothetical protein [Methanoculleus chikugoensis]|uniref:hypothetical protein n=1 Tax=Methanoculleus chikugoensis TaxID=118126 RepID=UPI001FB4F440|nr:hypothetical protein [Methanoculleus chikugoensis]